MKEYIWDGPEDSDEEIEDMAKLKTQYEIDEGIKFSKNGIMKYIEELLEKEHPKNEKKWV